MSSSSSLAAVVFDWAGTLFDFGSQAPMGAFVELFARHGVEISIDEARVPMGLPKWDHIQTLGTQPRIAAAWAAAHGRAPTAEPPAPPARARAQHGAGPGAGRQTRGGAGWDPVAS